MDHNKYLPPKYSHALKDLAEFFGVFRDYSPDRDQQNSHQDPDTAAQIHSKLPHGLSTLEQPNTSLTPRLEPILESAKPHKSNSKPRLQNDRVSTTQPGQRQMQNRRPSAMQVHPQSQKGPRTDYSPKISSNTKVDSVGKSSSLTSGASGPTNHEEMQHRIDSSSPVFRST